MNYFLMIVIIGIAGFAYYQHNQDEEQVAALQQQVSDLQDKAKSNPVSNTANIQTAPRPAPALLPAVKVIAPETHSSAIDQAAHAATVAVATDSNNLGNINTLDGRSFQNCKVLKVESDGVTFSHDEGITKILFPFLPPNIQKQFGYDPQKAAADADAEVRYAQQEAAAAASTNAPASTPVTQ
jgi:hypothetical protein